MITFKFLPLFLALFTLSASLGKAQLPEIPNKQQPAFDSKSFCPPMGSLSSHSDPERNEMKNRTDESDQYHRISLNDLKALPLPQGTLKKRRSEWAPEQKEVVKRNEGIPVVVQAYFLLTFVNGLPAGARPEGAESCNCWKADPKHVDYRLWLVNNVNDGKSHAIVAEITPRVRVHHAQWTLQNLTQLAQQRLLIRVYGWLMFEEDEQPQVGVSRATLWEIHPIMQIQFRENGVWKTL